MTNKTATSKADTPDEQLITEYIDIWSSAILAKSSSGRGGSKKYELYGIKKLRELIFDLAIRGKLISNCYPEESYELSNEDILNNKELRKLLGQIPFKIPSTWLWTTLSEISEINGGFAFKSSQ